uniref:Uncharacterized protein n=1 Tax=Cucumis melo TaxID=3656 RepID=A0A9I9ED91_CUCME
MRRDWVSQSISSDGLPNVCFGVGNAVPNVINTQTEYNITIELGPYVFNTYKCQMPNAKYSPRREAVLENGGLLPCSVRTSKIPTPSF